MMPTPMRILFLIRDLDIGGAQRQLSELAAGLHQRGWAVTVATFYAGGRLEPPLREAGVTIRSLGKTGRWDLFRFIGRLVSLVRRERPQIAHGYLDVPNILLALLRPFFPHTRIVWGVRASNMDVGQYDWMAAVESRLSARVSRLADLIICNSDAGRDYHAHRGYPNQKMVVIPNGVDVQRFRPDPDARSAVRQEWGVSALEPLVGLVARLDPMKDHPSFLKAAARVHAERRDVRFVCVGDGAPQYREALREQARDLGLGEALIWAGARNDVQRVYNGLDLAVSSSAFGEGFPNAVGEAMASGVPCVVTAVGDSARVVGSLGWVCEPSDSDALALSILHALRQLPADSAALSRRIRAEFSTASLVERTAGILGGLGGEVDAASSPRALKEKPE